MSNSNRARELKQAVLWEGREMRRGLMRRWMVRQMVVVCRASSLQHTGKDSTEDEGGDSTAMRL